MRDKIIQRIMTTNLITMNIGDPLNKALKIFQENNIHHLPVINNGKLVGLVSSSDLLHSQADTSQAVDTVMKTELVVVTSSSSLKEAAEKLSTGSYHSLPVVDHEGILIGIVTSTDLIKHLLMQIPTGDGSLDSLTISEKEELRLLQEVRHSVESYLRSGHNEREHGVLLKKLAALRNDNLTL